MHNNNNMWQLKVKKDIIPFTIIFTLSTTYLYVSKVHPIEIAEHLTDLRWILEHCSGSLGKVVEGGVATKGL